MFASPPPLQSESSVCPSRRAVYGMRAACPPDVSHDPLLSQVLQALSRPIWEEMSEG